MNDVQAPITPQQVRSALEANPRIGAVGITSPTYDGFEAPIKEIADECHNKGAVLAVDGAWGSCHGTLRSAGFPESAIERGADFATVSLHKKGLAPSQVSLALFGNARHAELMDACGNSGFQTTSPNYLSIAIAEHIFRGRSDQRSPWTRVAAAAAIFAQRISTVHPAFRVIRPGDVGALSSDPSHVLVHVGGANITGYELQSALSKKGFDAEKPTKDTLLFLIGPYEADRMESWLQIIASATNDVLSTPRLLASNLAIPAPDRDVVFKIRDAALGPAELVPMDASAGKVAAASIAVYPPGSALVVPGERIKQAHVDYLLDVLRQGGVVDGISGDLNLVRVMATLSQRLGTDALTGEP